jgi:hypothetical protein
MGEWLGLLLLVAVAGVGVTAAAALAARLMTEERKLARAFHEGLEAEPDAAVVARGYGCGAAINLATRRIVTVWDGGVWRMTYPVEALLGAEVDLDGRVVARVMRGQPRRLLDNRTGAETDVRLRLLFDDPAHPDFELTLWPPKTQSKVPAPAKEAISEANRWIGRIEAVMRRSGGLDDIDASSVSHNGRSASANPGLFDDLDPEEPG